MNWVEQGDKLHADELGTMFSGSGVVDRNNTTGSRFTLGVVLPAPNLLEIVTELNYRMEDIVPELMEVGFVYNEIGQIRKAIELLNPIERLEAYPWLKDDRQGQVSDIKPILQRISQQEYQKIHERYYPEMLLVEGGPFGWELKKTNTK